MGVAAVSLVERISACYEAEMTSQHTPEAFDMFAFWEGGHPCRCRRLLKAAPAVEHPVNPHPCVDGVAREDLQKAAMR